MSTSTTLSTSMAEPAIVTEVEQLPEATLQGPLIPGTYLADVLSLGLEITTSANFRLTTVAPGRIIFESVSSADDFTGVGFFVVDTLIDSDGGGLTRSRLPATVTLDDFLASRTGVSVVDRRTDELGGLPADVWRIQFTEPCDECWFEALHSTTGWANLWGIAPGQVQEIWTIKTDESPIFVTIEAPEDTFEAWSAEVQRHLFDGLRFAGPTGFSLHRPAAEPFSVGFGEYAIGRSELEFVDTSRPTNEVLSDDGLELVPGAAERRLLLSVSYPSEAGGFDAAPAAGEFPIVIVAPALFDAAISLPADRQLASHGFVVITVRFPESSFPGNSVFGVPNQPADISFVIDELERGGLPPALDAAVDVDRIGLIGHSGGATTALGLMEYACCQDVRIDAAVGHAATIFNFGSNRIPAVSPVLHIVSNGDETADASQVVSFHDTAEGPSTLAVLANVHHLAWLDPDSASYHDAFELSLAFLNKHLRDSPGELTAPADDSIFVTFDER